MSMELCHGGAEAPPRSEYDRVCRERDALAAELADQDRVLRQSAPADCAAASAVGTVQNYIVQLEQHNAQLEAALRTSPCPRPIGASSDGFGYLTTADCHARGQCGCDQGLALGSQSETKGDQT